jgi:glutamate-1-semialdehyde 2,1-aminomutase
VIEDFLGSPEDPGSTPVIHIVILIIGIVIYMTLVVQWVQRSLRNRMSDNATILERYLARTSQSEALARSARTVIPGGIVTDTRFFEPYGIYVERAAGIHKWDVDGNDYLDFFGGHGANILGHSHPVLVDAVTRAIQRGVQFAANQPLEVALAAEVLRHFPSAQRVRYTASGTEATLLALRLARAFTGRPKIVRFASHYHGWHDHAASGYVAQFDGGAAPGVLPEIAAQTILLQPNDRTGLERAVESHGPQIACFIIEPVGTHFGVVPTPAEFLHQVASVARSVGALFILDEVLSGFRVALGGAQEIYGLKPDLTTLAKVLCGGMPGGALIGRAEIMDVLDFDAGARKGRSKVLHQGTFTANPVSMAAGLAVLRELERIAGCARANILGALARRRLNELAAYEGLPFSWYGEFSAFHLFFRGPAVDAADDGRTLGTYLARPQPLTNRLRMALNVLGFDVNTRCSGLLSAIHTESDIEAFVGGVSRASALLRKDGLL